DLHMAARLARLERAGELCKTGNAVARLEAQIHEARARLVTSGRGQRPLPFVAQVGEAAAWRELMRRAAQSRRQGQRFAEVRDRLELEHARGHDTARGLPGDIEVERRQRRAALGREGQVARAELVALALPPRLQPADGRAELER